MTDDPSDTQPYVDEDTINRPLLRLAPALLRRLILVGQVDPVQGGRYGEPMEKKKTSRQQVYTLIVQIGRKDGDGLPEGATGAALMIYASGVDEAEAVRETVAILKQADTAPLDVTGYGTIAEREAEGHEIPDEERALMQRALDENSVIVAQMTPFFDGEELQGQTMH